MFGQTPVDYVHAECWMGGENTRPASSDHMLNINRNINRGDSGDFWVMGKIPPRSDVEMGAEDRWNGDGELVKVNKEKYSCVFGFKVNEYYTENPFYQGISDGQLSFNQGDDITISQAVIRSKDGGLVKDQSVFTNFPSDQNPITAPDFGYHDKKCLGSQNPPSCPN